MASLGLSWPSQATPDWVSPSSWAQLGRTSFLPRPTSSPSAPNLSYPLAPDVPPPRQGDLEEYCREQGIPLYLASVADPQSNGQVERSNGLILRGIRARLEVPLHRAAGTWVEELPSVLWTLRTTPNRSTGYTPFFMVYGAEAILPSDILHDSPRVAAYVEEDAELARQDALDL